MAGTLAAGTDTGPALPNRSLTDIERSRAFYDEIFALPVAFEVPADADDATREQLSFLYGGVIYKLGSSLLGLRPVFRSEFAEDRTGLDHVSFGVDSRSDLDAASAMLSERGIATATSRTSAPATSSSSATPTTSPSNCSRRKPDRRGTSSPPAHENI
jgi:hypothetical protein